jgi:hypothetical protein
MEKAHPPEVLLCGQALFLVAAVLAGLPIGVVSGPLDPPSCWPGSYARGVVRFCALDAVWRTVVLLPVSICRCSSALFSFRIREGMLRKDES